MCPVCGSVRIMKDTLMCEHCHIAILAKMTIDQENLYETKTESGLLIKSLFLWRTGDPFQGRIINGLKGKYSQRFWLNLSEEFARRYLQCRPSESVQNLKNGILVPAPSRARGRNHAKYWAEGLSTVLGIPILEPLELDLTSKSDRISQKYLDRNDRNLIKMRIKSDFNCPLGAKFKDEFVIFADDVVTTGATSKAAKDALNVKNSHFEIWSLSYRPLEAAK